MIHVLATIEVAPGQRDAFLAEFHRVMPMVQAEAGCLEYGPTVDAAIQLPIATPQRSNTVVVVEKWSSLEALQAHFTAEHMKEYRVRVKELVVVGVQLQVLQPA